MASPGRDDRQPMNDQLVFRILEAHLPIDPLGKFALPVPLVQARPAN